MKNKITWWLKFTIWLTYYKVRLVPDEVLNGRCIDCDANGECCSTNYCPCKYNEHLKLRT